MKRKKLIVWGTICLCFISLFMIFQEPVVRVIKPFGESLAVTSDTTKTDTIIVDTIFEKLLSDMVLVKGGKFVMGATEEQKSYACADEYPAMEFFVNDFYLCKYEVTQLLWNHVMIKNYPQKAKPSYFNGDDLPVERVSWDDCLLFINELNKQIGGNFRLPTEAEWEFASRGGINSKKYVYSGGDDLVELGWFNKNSEKKTHTVGSKTPNELGLYDMSGNVSEWCSDKYRKYSTSSEMRWTGWAGWADWACRRYYAFSGSKDYNFRGGCWFSEDYRCRSAKRSGNKQGFKSAGVGLRIAADTLVSLDDKNFE